MTLEKDSRILKVDFQFYGELISLVFELEV